MSIKVVEFDIRQSKRIDGLTGYDAVEILFKNGRDPVGRARVTCNGDSLKREQIYPFFSDLVQPLPLEQPDRRFPTVTVAICTNDRFDELANALQSLAHQQYQADEILVIDNGCQNEVRELVKRILPDSRYLAERKQGLNIARNRALSVATSDIIVFLDDDAVADPNWVRSVAECFRVFPRAAALAGLTLPLELDTPAQEMFEANGGFVRGFSRRILPQDGKRIFGLRVPLVVDTSDIGIGCNMAFKSMALKELHGFDEALDTGRPLPGGGDLDMLHRVARAGHEIVYEPRAIVRHRHRREEAELRSQLTGHQRAFMAFLVKTICKERGWARTGVALFLAWRLAKAGYRIFRGMIGKDPLPCGLLIRIFGACFLGFGSYHASVWRMRSQFKQSGGSIPGLIPQLLELLRYRELVWNLTARELKVKYQRSWLGFLWTLLNPLITIGVLVTVFAHIMRIPIDNYWAYLISGYFAWSFFSQTINGGVQAAVGNAYLTCSAYFPQEVLVLSSTLARLIEFLGELIIVLTLLAIFHHKGIPLSFVMVVPLVPILFLISIGLSFPLVALAVYYEDAVQMIPLATLVLFYLSPVFYNIGLVPENLRKIYLLNPIASLLDMFHAALYRGEMPNFMTLLALTGVASFLGLGGYIIFNRKKRGFAEIV